MRKAFGAARPVFIAPDQSTLPVFIASGQSTLPIQADDVGLCIVQTPIITAGAYSSGDALGGLLTFASAVRASGGTGVITKIVIVDDADQEAPIDLVFFDQTFTATGDNDAFDPSDADMQNCIGHVNVAATDYASFNDNGAATKRNVGFWYALAGTLLFAQMVVRDTPSYVATDDLTVKIFVERN